MLTLHTLIQTGVCYLYASFNSFERLRQLYMPYCHTVQIQLPYTLYTNSIEIPSHILHILPHLHNFFQCVRALANRVGGFRVRHKWPTLFAPSTFLTMSILLLLLPW